VPGLKDTMIGRGLDGLWSKLSTPGHQLNLPLGDETWLQVRAPAAIDYGPHRVVLDMVREAVRARRALRIHYRKSSGEESERVVEPTLVRWEPMEQALYLYAWCRTRCAPRTFAIHRIARAELTDEEFAPRREAVAELGKAFRLWARPGTDRVVLRFSPRVAGEIRERRWHPTASLTETPDGGVVLEMEVGAPEELERWLLGYGADVAVEAPATLAAKVHARHAEAAAPRFGLLPARRSEGAAGAATRRARSKP
jgi:predicted DNA-binding transcriptional regulator YafY